jgi:hypothetical protein
MEPAAIEPKTTAAYWGSRMRAVCIGRSVMGYRSSNAFGVGWSNGGLGPTVSVIARAAGYPVLVTVI